MSQQESYVKNCRSSADNMHWPIKTIFTVCPIDSFYKCSAVAYIKTATITINWSDNCFCTCIHRHNCQYQPFFHSQLTHCPLCHFSWNPIKNFLQIHKAKVELLSFNSKILLHLSYSNKKASIRWLDSVPPTSGYWPTSEPNAGDHDFPLTGSNCGNLTAFRAIFSHIFTAHAQERPSMNFRLKFWHHHSIPWSRFPYRARYFGDMRTFSVDFCIG